MLIDLPETYQSDYRNSQIINMFMFVFVWLCLRVCVHSYVRLCVVPACVRAGGCVCARVQKLCGSVYTVFHCPSTVTLDELVITNTDSSNVSHILAARERSLEIVWWQMFPAGPASCQQRCHVNVFSQYLSNVSDKRTVKGHFIYSFLTYMKQLI